MRAVVCRVGLVFGKEMKKESCIVKHDSICFSLERCGMRIHVSFRCAVLRID